MRVCTCHHCHSSCAVLGGGAKDRREIHLSKKCSKKLLWGSRVVRELRRRKLTLHAANCRAAVINSVRANIFLSNNVHHNNVLKSQIYESLYFPSVAIVLNCNTGPSSDIYIPGHPCQGFPGKM
eukprot:GHVU01157327.1.p1 GENE.GHVU01157327.1~~GHVU01157327.1.p1  ORF type:complete len:124 (-),score=1.55 GHVU01157327.1:196-567(-)